MKRIVAALDFSNASPGVLEMASDLAQAHGAELHLLHVLEPEPTYTAYGFTPDEFPAIHTFQEEARKRAKLKLEELAGGLPEGLPAVSAELGEGSPLPALVEFIKEKEADLLVLGSHGHGVVASLLIGSVAEGMIRKSLVPTLVVPAPGKG